MADLATQLLASCAAYCPSDVDGSDGAGYHEWADQNFLNVLLALGTNKYKSAILTQALAISHLNNEFIIAIIHCRQAQFVGFIAATF